MAVIVLPDVALHKLLRLLRQTERRGEKFCVGIEPVTLGKRFSVSHGAVALLLRSRWAGIAFMRMSGFWRGTHRERGNSSLWQSDLMVKR